MRFSTPGAGLEPVTAFCSDLRSGLELDTLNSTGIENRVICHAIGFQFVGCWATICLERIGDKPPNTQR